ncbi:MAG: redox-sensing transcriptional repressor Rex [Tepidanaerobacteraceae bacterium]
MAEGIKKVSMAVVRRLPKYYSCLGDLIRGNVERVSSRELSKLLGFTASQIRQDLNNFGGFGQQGYGYKVEQLYQEIANILGLNLIHKMVIIGAGNLGQALANYEEFEKFGFHILALFDVNPKLIGLKIRNIPVLDTEELKSFIEDNKVDIGVITVPKGKVGDVINILSNTPIKGIWNFTPKKVNVKKRIIVENVHLTDSLFTLSYQLNQDIFEKRCIENKSKKTLNR